MAISDTYATIGAILGAGEVVIPDMQRDYCWGAGDGQRVTAYVSAIAYIYGQRPESTPTIGQLYGYHYPAGSSRLCVIDGQQRITTLYLLLGMLYRRVPSDALRRMLISDDGTPRLVYQARREAQYFINDLSRHFFLNRDGCLSQLERSPWFFRDYESDPTIVGIIGAIRLIDQVLERAAVTIATWDFASFTRFVTDGLHFVVCDLGTRTAAEQFFVTINTTGTPLTAAQRLRAAIEQTGIPETLYPLYNDMEDWFWRVSSVQCPVTSDKSVTSDEYRVTSGDPSLATQHSTLNTDDSSLATRYSLLDTFLHVFALWHGPFHLLQSNNPFEITQEDLEATTREGFEQMFAFFDLYRRVMSTPAAMADALRHQAIDASAEANALLFRLMPCIALVDRFGDDATEADIDNLWRYLANITRYQRATAADWQAAVDTVRLMPTPDTLSLLKVHHASKRVVTDEARCALQYIAEHNADRPRAQALIRRAQDHPVLNGRTQALMEWSGRSLDKLKGYIDGLYQLFGTDIDEQPRLDGVRRALLTLGNREYPLVRRGNSLMSLCWQDYDWQRLVGLCPAMLRRLVDHGRDGGIVGMVNDFDDKSYPYYFLIKDPALMSQVTRRQFLKPCKVFVGLPIGDSDTLWYVEQQRLIDNGVLYAHGWSMVRAYGTRCLYTDHTSRNVAIDIYYQPDQRSPYRIEVFSRPDADPDKRRSINIKPLLAASGLTFRFDRERRRFYSYLPTVQAVTRAFATLVSQVGE